MLLKIICYAICLFSLGWGQAALAQGFDPLNLSGLNQDSVAQSDESRGASADELSLLPANTTPLLDDRVANITVLGQNLFNGNFGKQSFAGFNPYYRVSVGDKLTIQLWGAIESNGELIVDRKGNIFISQVGPVKVAGVLNSELNNTVANAIKKVYKKDVYVYVSLLESQPVRVFVTGNVINPGLYSGLSSESILAYLDRAGGIDPLRGSYIDIQLKRGNQSVEQFNLYDFLVKGHLPQKQLYEGDVIIVGSRKSVINFSGLVEKPYQIEFINNAVSLAEAIALVQPLPSATHIAIERNQGLVKQAEYLDLQQALVDEVFLFNGDSVNVVSDKVRGSIAVLVSGEHQGQAQYVLPYGARLADLLTLIKPSEHSNMSSLQIFRASLAKKQKAALHATLNTLQTQVMSARSDTVEEATLRAREASLIMQFVEKAKTVEPKGQLVLSDSEAAKEVVLENGDQLVIMAKNNLVNVSGEVLFPNAVIHNGKLKLNDYIGMAGGYTQNAKKARVILRKTNGAVMQISGKGKTVHKKYTIEAGDELLVLPDVDGKSMQFAKDVFQIIYQLALSTGVVLSID